MLGEPTKRHGGSHAISATVSVDRFGPPWAARSSQTGNVKIYEDRPIDCRLFPVDIREERDGTLVWIVYTRLCPAGFDRTGLLEHAERLLPALQGHAREYARVDTRGMDAEPFDVLLGVLTSQ